jgi:Uma2 family endonuclease
MAWSTATLMAVSTTKRRFDVDEYHRMAQYDRDVKGRIYAEAGVPEYWLVDLNTRSVSCHVDPRADSYHSVRLVRPGDVIAPRLLPTCAVPVDALMA